MPGVSGTLIALERRIQALTLERSYSLLNLTLKTADAYGGTFLQKIEVGSYRWLPGIFTARMALVYTHSQMFTIGTSLTISRISIFSITEIPSLGEYPKDLKSKQSLK